MGAATKMMVRLTRFGRQRAESLLIVILVVAMNGAQAHSRRSLVASQTVSDSQLGRVCGTACWPCTARCRPSSLPATMMRRKIWQL